MKVSEYDKIVYWKLMEVGYVLRGIIQEVQAE
jgi:hypothetical protein